jgi:4-carboxymuconolactone decarboxylase
MVELPSRPLAEVDPEFEKIALEGAAFTFGLPGTSIREKILQNLTQDVCRSQLGLAYRMHVTAAQMHGLSYAELLAAIRFIAPYSGYPAAADALARLNQIATEIGMNTNDLGAPAAPGADGSSIESLQTEDEWATEFLGWQVSRAWSEEALGRRERAVMAITSDVSQHALDDSFRLHVKLALDAGLSRDDVRDVVRFCAEHGRARAVAALRQLDNVLATE